MPQQGNKFVIGIIALLLISHDTAGIGGPRHTDTVTPGFSSRCEIILTELWSRFVNRNYSPDSGTKFLRESELPLEVQEFNQALWKYWRVFSHRANPSRVVIIFRSQSVPLPKLENPMEMLDPDRNPQNNGIISRTERLELLKKYLGRGELGYRLLRNDIFREMATFGGKSVCLANSAARDLKYTNGFGSTDFAEDGLTMISKISVHKDTPLFQFDLKGETGEVALFNSPEPSDVEWYIQLKNYFKVTNQQVFATTLRQLYKSHFGDMLGKGVNERAAQIHKISRGERLEAMESDLLKLINQGTEVGVISVDQSAIESNEGT